MHADIAVKSRSGTTKPRQLAASVVNALAKFLPVVLPSWRFFDEIAPSPRIEYALLSSRHAQSPSWHPLTSPSLPLSPVRLLLRLLWNPHWNEYLYLILLD
jgi:hypothetical protein